MCLLRELLAKICLVSSVLLGSGGGDDRMAWVLLSRAGALALGTVVWLPS